MHADLPILNHPTVEPAVFRPENLLARASEMMGKEQGRLPACCVLDFDGELAPVAVEQFAATPSSVWPCFHTTLLRLEQNGFRMGLIAGTVGAPYAVLVAEQLIACGCRYIIGYSSSGAVADWLRLPCLVVPDRALRDEGTSYHYLPPAAYVEPRGSLAAILAVHATECGLPVHRGPTWTTDAPYRETRTQIERHRADGILTVEMEAAALMSLAQVSGAEVASLLHVTNTFATTANDFDKGPADINQRVLCCCFEAFAHAMRAAHSMEGRRDEDS
ncbi:MAG: nucleoside phosphorylase [Pirellulaceae bacterium]